ncbi:MAG: hypothetical protein ACI9CD_000483 [Candidatus Deianiraeaceae bacterium]|jgi:hypothetical protein
MFQKLSVVALIAITAQACTITPNYLNGVSTIELTGNEKTGKACRFLGLGNSSVSKAAKNGKITKIKVVNKQLLPLVICTEVFGS